MNLNLSSISLFSGLSADNLACLSKHFQLRKYSKGHVIFNEGDNSDSMYIIISGQIRIYLSSRDKEMWLNSLGPGHYFGELELIDQGPRTASAITESEAVLYEISSDKMQSCLKQTPEITIRLLKVLVKNIRESTYSQKQLGLMDVYGRLRTTLIKLSGTCNGQQKIKPRPTHKELASRIGASREMVSRQMKDLQAGGYIECSKSSILIRRPLPEKW